MLSSAVEQPKEPRPIAGLLLLQYKDHVVLDPLFLLEGGGGEAGRYATQSPTPTYKAKSFCLSRDRERNDSLVLCVCIVEHVERS